MGLPGRQRSLTISSAVWIEYTNGTDRQDRQTDRRTDGGHRAVAKTALTHSVARTKIDVGTEGRKLSGTFVGVIADPKCLQLPTGTNTDTFWRYEGTFYRISQ